MNIALLNTRITIQQQTTTTDTIGNHLNTWQDYYTCAATVSGETNGEAEEAAITVDDTNASFTIRYCEKHPPLRTPASAFSSTGRFMTFSP